MTVSPTAIAGVQLVEHARLLGTAHGAGHSGFPAREGRAELRADLRRHGPGARRVRLRWRTGVHRANLADGPSLPGEGSDAPLVRGSLLTPLLTPSGHSVTTAHAITPSGRRTISGPHQSRRSRS
jgi:hypothetical protein